jgi:hypothetical protein
MIPIQKPIRINQTLILFFNRIVFFYFCSVENLNPDNLYEPVKVGQDDLTGDFLLLDPV